MALPSPLLGHRLVYAVSATHMAFRKWIYSSPWFLIGPSAVVHAVRSLIGSRSRSPRDWFASRRLAGSRLRLYRWDEPGDGLVHRQEDLLTVMVHLQRRAFEQAVRRFCCCHLDAQAAATIHEVEGEPFQCVGQPGCEPERALLQAHATEPRDKRHPGSRQ